MSAIRISDGTMVPSYKKKCFTALPYRARVLPPNYPGRRSTTNVVSLCSALICISPYRAKPRHTRTSNRARGRTGVPSFTRQPDVTPGRLFSTGCLIGQHRFTLMTARTIDDLVERLRANAFVFAAPYGRASTDAPIGAATYQLRQSVAAVRRIAALVIVR